jgi:hypothetical protein
VVHEGKSKGGDEWYNMDEKELRTFLAISLYMGMKKVIGQSQRSYFTAQ